jgi:SPP1 family predicted phage head-tail adaptor
VKGAGQLDYMVAFDRPTSLSDGAGGTEIGWTEVFSCWAGVVYLRGTESVMAARLSGRQPVVVTIRNCTNAQLVTHDWRMRDLRSSTIYNVRTAIPSDDRAFIELTCESGVAA